MRGVGNELRRRVSEDVNAMPRRPTSSTRLARETGYRIATPPFRAFLPDAAAFKIRSPTALRRRGISRGAGQGRGVDDALCLPPV